MAANWDGRPECTTSLPSWSCGFDSGRPASRSLVPAWCSKAPR